MGEGFTLLDREFRILAVNAEGLRLDGQPREALVGRTHWEAYPGSEHSELGLLYRRDMAGLRAHAGHARASPRVAGRARGLA